MTRITDINFRHPELVSGSMAQWFGNPECHGEISPVGIILVNKVDLPASVPALQLFLAGNGRRHVLEKFSVNQAVNTIAASEPGRRTGPMLPYAGRKVRRDADIECAAFLTGENVGARAAMAHGYAYVAPWTLKQVQGDGEIRGGEIRALCP